MTAETFLLLSSESMPTKSSFSEKTNPMPGRMCSQLNSTAAPNVPHERGIGLGKPTEFGVDGDFIDLLVTTKGPRPL
ncbi:MAG: hypothetical protein EHM37_13075 [Deltaproteobacteria bacterium]|nr:MAG: hypothetical protein EHM37_13075 [Deltaproteobacteria bacterium]